MLHDECPYQLMGGHKGEWQDLGDEVVCSLCQERKKDKPVPAPRKVAAKKEDK